MQLSAKRWPSVEKVRIETQRSTAEYDNRRFGRRRPHESGASIGEVDQLSISGVNICIAHANTVHDIGPLHNLGRGLLKRRPLFGGHEVNGELQQVENACWAAALGIRY